MDYERIVELIREIAPPLSLKSTKEDLAEAIRNIGINVKYSDMSHLPKDEGFIYGFVRTTQRDVDIIINAARRKTICQSTIIRLYSLIS